MMQRYFVPAIMLCASLTSATTIATAEKQAVPYPDALAAAAVTLDAVSDPLDNALIVGNGDLNGLIFSEGGDIVLRLTKNDVWDARLDTELDPPLPTLERLLELGNGDWPDKNWILPEGCDWEGPDSYHAHPYPCPRACAVVRWPGAAEPPLTAKLDVRRACVEIDAAQSETRAFIANHENVAVLYALGAAPVLEPVVSDDIPAAETGESDGCQWIRQDIPGDPDWPGMTFAVAAAASDQMTAVAVVTSRESKQPLEHALELAQATVRKGVEKIRGKHTAGWDAFWSRSGIELADPLLERTWYRNLYFLRCVSKPGAVAPGLFAGLIDDKPAWHGDYHTNYNIQQTFWAVYSANHCELAEPYDRLITGYIPRGRWLARRIFGCDGAYFPHVLFACEPSHPERCKSPNGRQYIHHVWGFTLGVAGFTVQPLWWHYKYDPDKQFLEDVAYPAVRDVAVFYADFVDRCERDGDKIILAPTVSPEHHGWTDRFKRNRNCAFCIAYFRFIFDAAVEGAKTLDRDPELVRRWQTAEELLPDYPLHGENEDTVVVDVAGARPLTYNIPVPTTPVFPADQVTRLSPESTLELFRNTTAHLRHNGNNAPIMLAVTRARLGMPDALEWLRTLIDTRERPNGTLSFNRLEPEHRFNRFGHYTEMFGAVLPITELLLQSVDGVLRVFPSWPEDLPARFERLRAEGGFLVSAEHAGGTVTRLEIDGTSGATLKLEPPWRQCEVRRGDSLEWKPVSVTDDGLIYVDMQPAGDTLRFRRKTAG